MSLLLDLDTIPQLPKRPPEQFNRKRKHVETARNPPNRSIKAESDQSIKQSSDEEVGQQIDSMHLQQKEEGEEKMRNQASKQTAKSVNQKDLPDDFKYQEAKYEYLDHTADVQFHTWGSNLEESFGQMLLCMSAFQIDTSHTKIAPTICRPLLVSADKLEVLLFQTMDEAMNLFADEDLMIGYVDIEKIEHKEHGWNLRGFVYGEKYDQQKHGRGTEIKAITYSNMQIYEKGKLVASSGEDVEDPKEAMLPAMHGADVYAIVDI